MGKFVIKDAKNGEIIGVGEGYKKKASCLNGIESIRKNAPDAPIDDTREAAKEQTGT